MSQTRVQSLLEAGLNTASGFLVSLVVSVCLFPIMGIPVTFGQNVFMTCVFTVTSIARSYLWRRFFNKREVKNVAIQ